MKHLYLWNDLPIFFNFPLDEIEQKFEEFIAKLNDSDRCKYYYIKNSDYQEWLSKLEKTHMKNVVTIGTRPNRVSFLDSCEVCNIKLKRKFNKNGFTEGVEFVSDCKEVLTKCISKSDEIHFVEDIAVGGKTLEFICNFISESKFNGLVYFHIFNANKISIDELRNEWGNSRFNFNVNSFMENKPIEKSTLLCIYDLFFIKLNDKYYIEREDLLEKFFYENVSCLKEIVNWSKKYIEEKAG